LPAGAGVLCFSPFRALAELAGFAAPCGLQIQLEQGGSLNPEMPAMLGCACGLPGCCMDKKRGANAKALMSYKWRGLDPVWRSRASQGKPEQARALCERNRAQRDRELRERRFFREAQGIPH